LLLLLLSSFIRQTDESNGSFSLAEMNDLLINVVLKDLSSFQKHIEGIIDPDDKKLFEDRRSEAVTL